MVSFGCNEVFLHEEFERVHLDYYTSTTPYFGRLLGSAYQEDCRQWLSEIDQALAGRATHLFLNASWKPFLKRNGFLSENSTPFFLAGKSFSRNGFMEHNLGVPSFSFGDGALSFMIAAAIFLGAHEIYLLGCGYTYSPRLIHHIFDALSIPPGTPESEAARWVEDFSAQYPGFDIAQFPVGHRNRFFSATIPFNDGDGTARVYHRLMGFAKGQGVRIVNVVPDGFSSAICDSISTSEFNERFCSKLQAS